MYIDYVDFVRWLVDGIRIHTRTLVSFSGFSKKKSFFGEAFRYGGLKIEAKYLPSDKDKPCAHAFHAPAIAADARIILSVLKLQNVSVRAIAEELHRSLSSINRKLRRDSNTSGYGGLQAQSQCSRFRQAYKETAPRNHSLCAAIRSGARSLVTRANCPHIVSNGMNAPTHNGIDVPKWRR